VNFVVHFYKCAGAIHAQNMISTVKRRLYVHVY